MSWILAIMISFVLVVATVLVHFKGLVAIKRFALFSPHRLTEWHLVAVILLILALHVAEILIFSGGLFVANDVLHLGQFGGERNFRMIDYFHFSAETFTTLGYGDIYPIGPLRILASLESITGLLLIAWSGAFSYATLQKLMDPDQNA